MTYADKPGRCRNVAGLPLISFCTAIGRGGCQKRRKAAKWADLREKTATFGALRRCAVLAHGFLRTAQGSPPSATLTDGWRTSWSRLPGLDPVGQRRRCRWRGTTGRAGRSRGTYGKREWKTENGKRKTGNVLRSAFCVLRSQSKVKWPSGAVRPRS